MNTGQGRLITGYVRERDLTGHLKASHLLPSDTEFLPSWGCWLQPEPLQRQLRAHMLATPALDVTAPVHSGTQPKPLPLLTLCFLSVGLHCTPQNPVKQVRSSSPYRPRLTQGPMPPSPVCSWLSTLTLNQFPCDWVPPLPPAPLPPGYFLLHSLHLINCDSPGFNTTFKLKANISNHPPSGDLRMHFMHMSLLLPVT